jgi:conjugative relaxase-like TrwC/TraI family protein
VLSVGKLSPAGAADYFLAEIAPDASGYYTGEGEAAGRWTGSLSAELGLVGTVAPDDFRAVLDGLDPRTGQRLVGAAPRPASARPAAGRAGFLSTAEVAQRLRVTLRHVRRLLTATEEGPRLRGVRAGRLWKVPADEVERYRSTQSPVKRRPGYDLTFRPPKSVSVLWALGDPDLRAAIADAHREAVNEALLYVEHAAGTVRSGKDRAHIEADGFVAAAFDHRTSRAGDPLLHTHVVVANLTRTLTGAWRAVDSRSLYRHARAGGHLYQAHLRHLLSARLGIGWEPVRNGWADVTGVPAEVVAAFSKRRAAIAEEVNRFGATSAAAWQAATLITRAAKEKGGGAGLHDRWAAEAATLGFGAPEVRACIERSTLRTMDEDARRSLLDFLAGPEGLTQLRSSFDRRGVICAVAAATGELATSNDVLRLADSFLGSARAVALRAKPGYFSTPELLRIETELVSWAHGEGGESVAEGASIERAVREHSLSAEQATAVHAVCATGGPVRLLDGRPGSGKTTTLGAVAAAFAYSDVPIVGTAVSAVAAAELEDAARFGVRTGRSATTLARLLRELSTDSRRRLAPRTVVVVDEASMAPTRDLHALARHVKTAGGALLLAGDPDQHGSVQAGGLFAALVASTPTAATLTESHRLRDPVSVGAVASLRNRDTRQALDALDGAGRLHLSPTADDLHRVVVDRWMTACEGNEPMLAGTNATRRALNRAARDALAADGRLAEDLLRVAGRDYAIGDVVVARRNDRRLTGPAGDFVKNGSAGRIVSITNASVAVEFRREGHVRLPMSYLQAGALEHGYARTTYSVQGATLQRAVYAPSDASSFEEGYVALTRAVEATELFIVDGERTAEKEQHPAVARPVVGRGDVEAALARRRANELAGSIDGTDSAAALLAELPLSVLERMRAQLQAELAHRPPDVASMLADAERRRDDLRVRERERSAYWLRNRDRASSWITRQAAMLDATIDDLMRRHALRERWHETHREAIEGDAHVRAAIHARGERVEHGVLVDPPEALIEQLGPCPQASSSRHTWEREARAWARSADRAHPTR